MDGQSPSTDRSLAEQLARSGQTVEALAIFERIVTANPTDVEVRLWIARLQLRMGRTDEAEAGFRAVVLEHPSDVDAARPGFLERDASGVEIVASHPRFYWARAAT